MIQFVRLNAGSKMSVPRIPVTALQIQHRFLKDQKIKRAKHSFRLFLSIPEENNYCLLKEKHSRNGMSV